MISRGRSCRQATEGGASAVAGFSHLGKAWLYLQVPSKQPWRDIALPQWNQFRVFELGFWQQNCLKLKAASVGVGKVFFSADAELVCEP
jgi:hypothetical protein